MANSTTEVSHQTTRCVTDRLAKIAATYTNGYTTVRYVGNQICTDVKGTIYLPAYLQDLKPGDELNAWAYTSHEMGHQGVENDLKIMRRQRKKITCSKSLRAMVPAELEEIAVTTGDRIKLSSEVLEELDTYATAITEAYGGHHYYAATQLKVLINVFEDPRMEAQVSRRWAGAADFLKHGNKTAYQNWRSKAEALIAEGKDRSFDVFAIGLLFAIAGEDSTFLGPIVKTQVDACSDVIELFQSKANWRTSEGFWDSVNAAVICLSRVYREETGTEAPKPTCPNCESENVKGTFRKPNIVTLICLDCGHREEEEVNVEDGTGGAGGMDEGGMELEMEGSEGEGGEGEGSEGEGEGEGEGSEGEGKGEGEGSGGEGDADGEGADGEGEGSDGKGKAQGEGDTDAEGGESDKGGSGESDDAKDSKAEKRGLSKGMIVRVKADGSRRMITKVHKDGSVEAELVA